MRQPAILACHPVAAGIHIGSITATAARISRVELALRYAVTVGSTALQVPRPRPAQRRDELWRHTCAELFVALPEQSAYCEFNFSPSSEWAAYRFDGYRKGMCAAQCEPPDIAVSTAGGELQMTVRCSLPSWLAESTHLLLGVTMVIEDLQGRCSYWALKHPADKPDFHHRDGFVLEL